MTTPIFFTKISELRLRDMLRPLEQCFFNKIELECPKCKGRGLYNNTMLCGDEFIVCDYCSFDIPLIEGKVHVKIQKGHYKDVTIVRSRI